MVTRNVGRRLKTSGRTIVFQLSRGMVVAMFASGMPFAMPNGLCHIVEAATGGVIVKAMHGGTRNRIGGKHR